MLSPTEYFDRQEKSSNVSPTIEHVLSSGYPKWYSTISMSRELLGTKVP